MAELAQHTVFRVSEVSFTCLTYDCEIMAVGDQPRIGEIMFLCLFPIAIIAVAELEVLQESL